MKVLLLIFAVCGAVLCEEEYDYSFHFPNVKNLNLTITEETIRIANLSVSPTDLTYIFYNIDNVEKGVEIKSTNPDAVSQTKFSGSKDLVIAVHGYGDTGYGLLPKGVRRELAAGHHDVNIISLDYAPVWKNNAQNVVIASTPKVGEFVADFLKVLSSKHGLKIENIQIVGHSFGGFVGAKVGAALNGRIAGVIGLDPYPGLSPSDAKFVEIVHTTSGMNLKQAHADYYPNGGAKQNGCNDGGCNHYRAIPYYCESINSKKFVAKQCDSYQAFQSGQCNSHTSSIMGTLDLDSKARGKFVLDTNANAPFAKG